MSCLTFKRYCIKIIIFFIYYNIFAKSLYIYCVNYNIIYTKNRYLFFA